MATSLAQSRPQGRARKARSGSGFRDLPGVVASLGLQHRGQSPDNRTWRPHSKSGVPPSRVSWAEDLGALRLRAGMVGATGGLGNRDLARPLCELHVSIYAEQAAVG